MKLILRNILYIRTYGIQLKRAQKKIYRPSGFITDKEYENN